jgi:dUTP pyrophosphatase
VRYVQRSRDPVSTVSDGERQLDFLHGVLSREQIRAAIGDCQRPLITDWLDLDSQLQPNGFDLTLREVRDFTGGGVIGVAPKDRYVPELTSIKCDEGGWFDLGPGIYDIVYKEIVDLPPHLTALGRPRSSLGRSGVTIHTAVWDAGYRGRSTSLLSVLNPAGFRVQRDARVMQLVFFGMATPTTTGYHGRYQDENIGEADPA